jgi:hypothetical protein
MPELGTSGYDGGPGRATAQVYPTALDLASQHALRPLEHRACGAPPSGPTGRES